MKYIVEVPEDGKHYEIYTPIKDGIKELKMNSDGYPVRCPVCDSDDIATDYIIGGDGVEIWVKCHCDDCKSSWGEAYRFCEVYQINNEDI